MVSIQLKARASLRKYWDEETWKCVINCVARYIATANPGTELQAAKAKPPMERKKPTNMTIRDLQACS